MSNTIYVIGFIVALCYVFFSIDDVIWDVAYLFRGGTRSTSRKIPLESLDAVPPKLLAVVIAAWHEDGVLEPVIDHMLASLQYPRSMYHVFLGVYPNDTNTITIAQKLAEKYDNVHVVVNDRPGPSSKADNLNHIIKYIEQFETDHSWRFSSITVHDSEDVIHPYELRITNYLIDHYDALQFPVFPIQRMPSFRNFWAGMTTGTYADEFAENHFRTMQMRDDMSALVPSAGTGFVISHRILENMQTKPLFPEDSLTEDYRLSLVLAKQGFHVHYVLEKVPRLLDNDKVIWDYVATRSIFPATFRTAVRQKTRWIFGITMQSIKASDIFKRDELNLAGRYTIYKDSKAKIANLLVLPGYLVFTYFLISLFVQLPIMYPAYTFSWWLCVFLSVMMVVRQVMRAIAIKNVYGFKSVVAACLLPPLMPIRLIYGNIINMCATISAWKLLLFRPKKEKQKTKIVWNKTDHEFLSQHVLYRYYRNIGDELLEKGVLDPTTLRTALKQSRQQGVRLGDVLLQNRSVTEDQLIQAVSSVQHRLFVKNLGAFSADVSIDKGELEELLVYPLMKTEDYWVFAQTNVTPPDAYKRLKLNPTRVHIVYATKDSILKALHTPGDPRASREYRSISDLLLKNKITWEQAVLALDHQDVTPNILRYMGLRSETLEYSMAAT
ncbi:phage adsorption protein NrfB [bacterium]|nr:phage adsorption protein NrfB [bacterium]